MSINPMSNFLYLSRKHPLESLDNSPIKTKARRTDQPPPPPSSRKLHPPPPPLSCQIHVPPPPLYRQVHVPESSLEKLKKLCLERMAALPNLSKHNKGYFKFIGSNKGPLLEIEYATFLYYLESQREVPVTHRKLIDHRISDLSAVLHEHTQVNHYLEQHHPLLVKQLPLTKKQMILRSLVRMIVTPSGTFIPEGLKAAAKIVMSSVGTGLRDAHQYHIYQTLKEMIASPDQYVRFFERIQNDDVQISNEMAHLIRLDLQLPLDAPITPSRLSWSLLKALFEPSEQPFGHPTCYAISATNYISVNHPYKFLCQLLAVIEKGTVYCDGIEIPLLDDETNSFLNPSLLEIKIKPDLAARLPMTSRLLRVTGITPQEDASGPDKKIKELIPEKFHRFAAELLTAHTANPLRTLMLIAGEKASFNDTNLEHSDKKSFINHIIQFFQRNKSISQVNLNQLEANLKTAIFVSEYNNYNHCTPYDFLSYRLLSFRDENENFVPVKDINELIKQLAALAPNRSMSKRFYSPSFRKVLLVALFEKKKINKYSPFYEAFQEGKYYIEPAGGWATDIFKSLYGFRIVPEYLVEEDTIDETLLGIYDIVSINPKTYYVIESDEHDYIIRKRELMGFSSRLGLAQTLNQLKDPSLLPYDHLFDPPSDETWEKIAQALKINLKGKEISKRLQIKEPQHSYALANHVSKKLKQAGYWSIDFCQTYYTLSRILKQSHLIPIAYVNWTSGQDPEAKQFEILSAVYDQKKQQYKSIILNPSKGFINSDFELDSIRIICP